jgi:hypothetical protein
MDTLQITTYEKSEKGFVIGLLSLISSLALTSIVLLTIAHFYHPVVDLGNASEILALYPSELRPEPLERSLYVVGIIITPIAMLLFNLLFRKLFQRLWLASHITSFRTVVYPALSIILIVFAGFVISKVPVYLEHGVAVSPLKLLLLVFSVIFLYIALTNYPKKLNESRWISFVSWFMTLLAVISCILVSLYGLFSLHSVTYDPIYLFSFNAVFHAVVQVYLGKAILIDLPHQYGLYPHFIEPLFRLTGLTILTFTILMSLLSAISLYCIVIFLRLLGTNRILTALGVTGLVYFYYFSARLIDAPDPGFQGLPLRVIFPALSLVLTVLYLQNERKHLYYFSFVLYSFAMFWNFDTGFLVFCSWLLLLIYKEAERFNYKGMVIHCVVAVCAVAGVTLFCYAYLTLRYGSTPDFGLMFEYQKIFYIYGNGMLPMPLWHPWILVLLSYAVGILYAIHCLINKEVTVRSGAIFYLSILGVGIFSFYQGRSHDMCLLGSMHPAIILLTLLCDSLLNKISSRHGNLGDKLIFGSILLFLVYGAASQAVNTREISMTIYGRLLPIITRPVTQVTQNAEFIRKNAQRGDDVFIYSMLSGVYYLELGMPCNVKIPGTTELSLYKDLDKIYRHLSTSNHAKIFVDYSVDLLYNKPYLFNMLQKKFKILSYSPNGSMLLLEKI